MIYLLSLILLSSADVHQLLTAKTPAEILSAHQRDEEVSVLRQRCEAEVRGSYFPTNCFLWASKAKLGSREKAFFAQWFDEACVKALREDVNQVRFHLAAVGKVRGACRMQAVKAAQSWLYKVRKEGETNVFQHLKVGNEIEFLLAHETLEAPRSHRHTALGAPR